MSAVPRALQSDDARSISEHLAQFVAGLEWDAIPAAVVQRAKYLILDAVGCGLAAKRFDFAAPSLRAIAELAGPGDRTVIAHAGRLPLRDAVLANGLLMHGLDYDDTHTEGVVHLTVSVLPAALALSAQLDRTGRDFLVAYIAGIEAGARIGAAAKGGFHQAGFHPTGVVGAFACALAAGRLYGLDVAALARAEGIALSVASGSLEFLEDGAWTKRFHPGWAGVGGITAAAMARHRFPAPRAAYEGRFGLYRSHLGELHDACDHARAKRGLGEEWETLNVALKPYPACHLLHALVDAALELRRRGIEPSQVRAITALVPGEAVNIVCEPQAGKQRPANDYDAKFSVPYAVATALRAGRFTLTELEPSALADPQTLALAAKVGYRVDPDSGFPRYYSGELIVTMADGRELRHREHINRGNAERPLSNADIEAKFMQNAGYGVPRQHAELILAAVLGVERAASARDLERVLGEHS